MQRFENFMLHTDPERSWLLTNGFDDLADSFFSEVFSRQSGGGWTLEGSFYVGDDQEFERWLALLPGDGVAIEDGDFVLPEPIRPERPVPVGGAAVHRRGASSAPRIVGLARGLFRPGRG